MSASAGTAADSANGPDQAGLYVHVPFCSRVCPYCDFAVLTDAPKRRQRYLAGLLREAELAVFPDVGFDTVYLGGGTPSLLREDELATLLEALARRFRLSAPWITLEANPEDVTVQAAGRWLALGIRTLSLGIQSFDDAELRFLGRAHDGARALAAANTALSAGFDVVSVDLIYGLPGQDLAAWEHNLARLFNLQPEHASCYQLTVHDGTRFGKQRRDGTLAEMPSERQAEMFLHTHLRFAESGWDGYEVSNFARAPGLQSRHNRKYWRHAPYLGLGPSAHSYDGNRSRWWNRARLGDWAAALERDGAAIEDGESLTPGQLALESLLFGLRTRAGVDVEAVRQRTGVDLMAGNGAALDMLVAERLLAIEGARWLPTLRGMAVAEWLALQIEVPVATGA